MFVHSGHPGSAGLDGLTGFGVLWFQVVLDL